MIIGLVLGLVLGGAAVYGYVMRPIVLMWTNKAARLYRGTLLGEDIPPPLPWGYRAIGKRVYIVDAYGVAVIPNAVPASTAQQIVTAVNARGSKP